MKRLALLTVWTVGVVFGFLDSLRAVVLAVTLAAILVLLLERSR